MKTFEIETGYQDEVIIEKLYGPTCMSDLKIVVGLDVYEIYIIGFNNEWIHYLSIPANAILAKVEDDMIEDNVLSKN